MNTFMVKVTMKKSQLSGYTWMDDTPSNLDGYVEVEAETLYRAVELVKQKYGDKKKYWIKADESYMKLEQIKFMNDNMTKQEALKAMETGYKLTQQGVSSYKEINENGIQSRRFEIL